MPTHLRSSTTACCSQIQIDDFLNIHESSPAVVEVGKAAIVRSILHWESKCKLYVDPSNPNNKLGVAGIRDPWFVKFMEVLGPGRKVHQVENVLDDVSFINFNYDRCLEYFLRHALQLMYGIQLNQAAAIVAKANIIHPYGNVGPLEKVPFGGFPSHAATNYRELSKAIKTYTEQIGEASVLDNMQTAIQESACIVFLGFAYHEQNMALLKPTTHPSTREVYGTAYEMSDSDVSHVVAELDSFFPEAKIASFEQGGGVHTASIRKKIRIENKPTCARLFDDYAKSLAG